MSVSGKYFAIRVRIEKPIFSQLKLSEEDKTSNCVNYPTPEYDSYADCDEDYIKRTLPTIIRPFWFVRNISQATKYVEKKDLKRPQREVSTELGKQKI